jgi:peptidoglycan/xylan/chitin deacetylase (PgdA/CDA1 family)
VGFLFARTGEALRREAPALRPSYREPHLSPYRLVNDVGADEVQDPFHLAPSLVRRILATPGQELGSHTHSHYYCLEAGQTAEEFAADLRAAQAAAGAYGVHLKSLVFPRTQVNLDYLPLCAAAGFTSFRAADPGWMNAPKPGRHSLVRRGARLADSYARLQRDVTFGLDLRRVGGLVAVPASRFLRPRSHRLRHFERLKVGRIRAEMTQAARRGRGYHLWWHPENFGSDTGGNLALLDAILAHYARLRDRYGFESRSMADLAEGAS